VAREGDIRNLVPCHGIEDRGDGHDAVGGKYLASTALARREDLFGDHRTSTNA